MIHETTLRQSPRITTGNFSSVADADLSRLFDCYDEQFFSGDLRRLVSASGAPLIFKFSPRLTRSGGLTKRFLPLSFQGGAIAFETNKTSAIGPER